MMLETIVDLVFLVVAGVDLALLLRRDVQVLQQHDYLNSRYYQWIQSSDEYLTVKRVIALVVFIASVTTMAVNSPYVVAALALVLLLQAISQFKEKKQEKPLFNKRLKRLYFTQLALMLFVAAIVYLTNGLYYAGVTMVFFLAFSYAFTIAVNWLMKPVEDSWHE